MPFLLAIDAGTTSVRANIYDESLRIVSSAQEEFPQYFPQPGWVEHDASEIWRAVTHTMSAALQKAGDSHAPIAIGITNQRESIVLWERATGQPVHRVIVWQDRRTAPLLERLEAAGHGQEILKLTGLVLDPYFSASKLAWILEKHPELKTRAIAGDLAAGTVETWIVWKLTAGASHLTDFSNASRTMLMDLEKGEWCASLCHLFDIPEKLLPEIVPNAGSFGRVATGLPAAGTEICGLAGDQQSALFGQHCTEPGMMKCTFGTGCFLLMQTGTKRRSSKHHLLSTAAWQLPGAGRHFALEGAVFVGGSAIQWLRDGLCLIQSAPDVNALAASVPDSDGVMFVPAFTGLGAPHWDPGARGLLIGLSRGTTAAHVARATLDGIAMQVVDVVRAMSADAGSPPAVVRVDGGASASDLLMQTTADYLGVEIQRPTDLESTALGAALFAGIGCGLWDAKGPSRSASPSKSFHPSISEDQRATARKRWQNAVARSAKWETE